MILRKHVSSKINEAVLLVLDRFLSELCPVISSPTRFIRIKC